MSESLSGVKGGEKLQYFSDRDTVGEAFPGGEEVDPKEERALHVAELKGDSEYFSNGVEVLLLEPVHHIDHGRQQHCVLNLTDVSAHGHDYLVGKFHQLVDGLDGLDHCAPVDPFEQDVGVLGQEGVLKFHYPFDDVSGEVERRGEE